MKNLVLCLLTLASLNVSASEIHCSGDLVQIKATLNETTKVLTNLTVFQYNEGKVTKNKAAKVEAWESDRNKLSFELPGADRENNESWALVVPTTKLKAGLNFKAKIHYSYCVGEDEAAISCYVTK